MIAPKIVATRETSVIYHYVDLTIDSLEFQVTRNSELIKLPKLSFELFLYFLKNSERVCSVEELAENVWSYTQVSDETVIQRVTLLRKALNDDSKQPKYIASIRGRGYRLIQSVNQKPRNLPRIKSLFASGAVVFTLSLILLILVWLFNTPEQASSKKSTGNSEIGLLERAKYYQQIGQRDDLSRAVELYRQLLKKQPENIRGLIGLSNSLNGLVCRYNLDKEYAIEAQKLAERALALQNQDAGSWEALGFSWDCQGSLEKALSAYLKAVEFDSTDFNSLLSAAHLLTTKANWIESLKLIKESKALNNNSEMGDLRLAEIYELSDFPLQAEILYKKLFQLYPDNIFINEAYPRYLYIQGNLSEAKGVFDIAISRDIDSAYLYIYYAELTWLLEGRQQSLKWFQKASQINPNKSFPKTVGVILNQTITTSQATEKIKLLNENIAWGDTWPITFVEKALLQLTVLNQPQSSITTLQQAVEAGFMESEYLQISPLFNQLKELPEFFQLIDRINQRRTQLKQKLIQSKLLQSADEMLNKN